MSKEINIKKTIEEAAKASAVEVINSLKEKRMIKSEMPFYKRVELLLYNYNNLREAVKQKEEDIDYLEKHGLAEKSKSVVIYARSSGGTSKEDRYIELKAKYKLEKEETLRDIRRIDNALSKVNKDRYYNIIRLKYLSTEEERVATDEKLAEKLNVDQSTITRNRKRLINKLTTILFPESIKDFA